MTGPPLEVADIFRAHADAYLEAFGEAVSSAKRRVIRDLSTCRTAALGGRVERCDRCDYVRIVYNACRNRHCPKCQAAARAEWLEARESDLLPVEYFHVVFTLPTAIAEIALQNKKAMYGILLRASADTLLQIAADARHLGARIGFLSVLHTWGQNLHHHPHVHCVVPGGGLSVDGSRWVSCPPGFFLPVDVLSPVFRGKFLALTRQAFNRGELSFQGHLAHLNDPDQFVAHLRPAYATQWVVYAKPPFGGPRQVLKYLARYTHRVAISNRRLVSLSDRRVRFRYKDYARGSRHRTMELDTVEFIRRFLLHTLPRGFVRIRHYGLLSNPSRTVKLSVCRVLLGPSPQEIEDSYDSVDPTTEDHSRCPVCKAGRMVPETLPPDPDFFTQHRQPVAIDSS